ncbi:hypothetical protein GOODEAATRI_032821 [Goodea atripinnis]|uniref:G-protein coupled receptors family 1 profile domain-containing protein n=1 Tax=Goodea atripinnis TaxID=208336 RepID=A0ABV0MML6_9TELE
MSLKMRADALVPNMRKIHQVSRHALWKLVLRSLVDFSEHCAEFHREVRSCRGTYGDAERCFRPLGTCCWFISIFGTCLLKILTTHISTMSEEHTDSNSSGYNFDNPSTRIQSSFVFSGPIFVILIVMMVTLVVVIVLGNALVIWAFKVDKSLRRQCNYYFLNLAISDFLVGAFCIPVYIPYILTGRWTLGRGLCKLWLVTDYLLCSASVFSIVLISYDRFLSVTRAVS